MDPEIRKNPFHLLNSHSKTFLVVVSLFYFASTPFAVASPSGDGIAPVNLRCEHLRAPLGIDIPRPRLSWNLASENRNSVQYAYEILAASSLSLLQADKGDLWSTGRYQLSGRYLHQNFFAGS